MARVQHQLGRSPRPQRRQSRERLQLAAVAVSRPSQRQMGLKGPRLGRQTRSAALGLDMCGQRNRRFTARREADPDNSHSAAALEGADFAELDVEPLQVELAQPPGDVIDQVGLNGADESNRQV
jgi:hypothetical protein